MDELEKAIAAFPADEDDIRKRLFRSTNGKAKSLGAVGPAQEEGEYNDDDDDETTEREPDSKKEEDVREILQRIRARCKVLTAKLGIPHHSLKNIMAEAAKTKAAAAASSSSSPSQGSGSGIANKLAVDDNGIGSREW